MLWRKALIYWKSIVVACAIAYVSLLREPSVALPPINSIDKYIHGLMYLILTWMLLWDSKKAEVGQTVKWIITIAFPIIYGGGIEILQECFLKPRTGDWLDWGADSAGVVIGIGLWTIKESLRNARGMDK